MSFGPESYIEVYHIIGMDFQREVKDTRPLGEFWCVLKMQGPKDSSPHTLGSLLALHRELGSFRNTAPAPGSSRMGWMAEREGC